MKPRLSVVAHVEVTPRRVPHDRGEPAVYVTNKRAAIAPAHPLWEIRILKLRNVLGLLLALMFPISTAQATSIVIRKTATNIFAAADSKVVHPTGELDSTMDKIIEIKPGWYVAAAGKLQIGTGLIFNDFDVFKSVRSCNSLMGSSVGTMSLFAPMTLREFATKCSQQISIELLTLSNGSIGRTRICMRNTSRIKLSCNWFSSERKMMG